MRSLPTPKSFGKRRVRVAETFAIQPRAMRPALKTGACIRCEAFDLFRHLR